MHTSPNGRRLIEQFEGLRLHAYRDQGGVWTAGYGDTAGAGGLRSVTGRNPGPGESYTQEECDAALSHDLLVFEPDVMRGMGKFVPTQNQFDACMSLAFNLGGPRFRMSLVAERLRAGDPSGAATAFMRYVTAGGRYNQGLANRRHAEAAEFVGHGVHVGVMMAMNADMGCERAVPDDVAA